MTGREVSLLDDFRQMSLERSSDWDEHGRKWACGHEKTEIRKRTIKGGAVQFRYQCLRCGDGVGGAIGREKALSLCGDPSDFDEELCSSWVAAKKADAVQLSVAYKARMEMLAIGVPAADSSPALFFAAYDEYLRSEKWHKKRAMVLERANGLCEGCRLAAPSQVHHLTYRNVGDELLFQLVALCDGCHEKCHP